MALEPCDARTLASPEQEPRMDPHTCSISLETVSEIAHRGSRPQRFSCKVAPCTPRRAGQRQPHARSMFTPDTANPDRRLEVACGFRRPAGLAFRSSVFTEKSAAVYHSHGRSAALWREINGCVDVTGGPVDEPIADGGARGLLDGPLQLSPK